jgi:hypothetical protein
MLLEQRDDLLFTQSSLHTRTFLLLKKILALFGSLCGGYVTCNFRFAPTAGNG